jgi:hypothetical protein
VPGARAASRARNTSRRRKLIRAAGSFGTEPEDSFVLKGIGTTLIESLH